MTATPIAGADPLRTLSGSSPSALGAGDPDEALPAGPAAAGAGGAFARAVAGSFEAARRSLDRAGAAESAFLGGRGTLQAMVLERAQADIALQIASSAASRVTQSLTTILGMQV